MTRHLPVIYKKNLYITKYGFYSELKIVPSMTANDNCALCNGIMEHSYVPMKEWHVDGHVCGKCYSKKIAEFYPGEHERVNLSDR